MTEYKSAESARAFVGEYVRYCRFDRKHSPLGYHTPCQFARQSQAES